MNAKTYNTTMNVGKARYVLTFCSGETTYQDGSLALDVYITNNKKHLRERIKALEMNGYKQA